MRVYKFGGSCIQQLSDLNRIAEILKNEDKPVIVTSSAMFGITQFIIQSLSHLQEKEIPYIIRYLRDEHLGLLPENVDTKGMEEELEKLERLLFGVVLTGEITPRTRDLIVCSGEMIIVQILKSTLQSVGLSVDIIDSRVLIRTNGVYGTSTVLLDETEANCRRYMEYHPLESKIYLVPGFIGASADNTINLLGRSGTDYSATALAYGFDAEEIVIWKDVLGFMTADPKIIEHAVTIKTLSYEEATELSHFGARILHSRSVIPAKIKNIPIRIRNFTDSNTSTHIWNKQDLRDDDVIKSITYKQDMTVLRIYTTLQSYDDGVFGIISNKLLAAGTPIISIATSQTCISFLIAKEHVDKSLAKLKEITPHVVDDVECDPDIALIGIVGYGLGNTPGIAARVFNAIAREGVNVEIISSGASKAAFHFSIKQECLVKSLKVLHDEFFQVRC
ncbi:MAG: aspartate kinase [Candidatus Heimdallarchaeota archaeon]|nr:aspartate kinase [Candidatus Heimdallarchaeota archaeon]